jgi:P pilus assembly chaperone PapD
MTACRMGIVLCVLLSLAPMARAGIVMVGTRIVYSSESREETLQSRNAGSAPVIIQAWADTGDKASAPDTADAPFMVMPPVARVEPGSGQALRLVFTGVPESLPRDRETLFYFNLLEIPAMRSDQNERNKLVLMTRHRLKLFYRPATLGDNKSLLSELRFSRHSREGGEVVRITNPSGFYASFRAADVTVDGGTTPLREADMVPPYSSVEWSLPESARRKPIVVRVVLVNDLGGDQQRHLEL